MPYRKRDGTRARDEPMHRYFAGHGYAALRVDLRGSGDSDGRAARRVPAAGAGRRRRACIAWIARAALVQRRRRHDGHVLGRLQRAAGRGAPAAGAARRSSRVCSTDDRYADDAHYMGGCLLNENLTWGSVLFTLNAPAARPGARRRALARRCGWSGSRRRASSPRSGCATSGATTTGSTARSARTTAAIECPVYAVGGWADGYSNAVPRLLAGLDVPAQGAGRAVGARLPARRRARPGDRLPAGGAALVGPLAARAIDTGIDGRAGLSRLDAGRACAATPASASAPGRWVAETSWPSPRIEARCCSLSAQRLGSRPGEAEPARPAQARRCSSPADRRRLRRRAGAPSVSTASCPATSAPTTAGSLVLRLRAAGRAARDPRRAGARARARRATGPRRSSPCACATSSPDGASTRVTYGLLEPDAPRRPRARRRRWSRAGATASACR